MKRSKERYNTTPRKKDVKFVTGKESNEKDDLIRSGTLTQENISKDKKRDSKKYKHCYLSDSGYISLGY